MRFRSFAFASLVAAATAFACGAPSVDGDPLGSEVGMPDRLPSSPEVDANGTSTPPPADKDASTVTDTGVDAGGPLRAFVSSAVVNANFNGLAGADLLCNNLATAQGLPGTYRAWLSVNGTNAADRITSNGPWQLVTGEVVAATKAELVSGTLKRPLNKDEKGNTPPAVEDRVWTATGPNGAFSGTECTAWTGSGTGRVGEAEFADDRWTSAAVEACSEVNRVYCFQL